MHKSEDGGATKCMISFNPFEDKKNSNSLGKYQNFRVINTLFQNYAKQSKDFAALLNESLLSLATLAFKNNLEALYM